MKTKTWIAIIGAVLVICAVSAFALLGSGEAAVWAEISSRGQVIRTVDLRIDQEFVVQTESGSNTVTVKDGKIAVTEADCPDHYCMDRGFCDRGAQIVCLPNRLVIKFVGEQPIDGVVG